MLLFEGKTPADENYWRLLPEKKARLERSRLVQRSIPDS